MRSMTFIFVLKPFHCPSVNSKGRSYWRLNARPALNCKLREGKHGTQRIQKNLATRENDNIHGTGLILAGRANTFTPIGPRHRYMSNYAATGYACQSIFAGRRCQPEVRFSLYLVNMADEA
jgi:hypothetical protein